jgi:hypothetical protein
LTDLKSKVTVYLLFYSLSGFGKTITTEYLSYARKRRKILLNGPQKKKHMKLSSISWVQAGDQ